jgi:hypothetical protein
VDRPVANPAGAFGGRRIAWFGDLAASVGTRGPRTRERFGMAGIAQRSQGAISLTDQNLYKLDKRFYDRDDNAYQKKLYGRFTA